MPSERIASEIESSLAPGERLADFAYLFDALMFLRQPYHRDLSLSEEIVRRIVCIIFVPDKPGEYLGPMQKFRLRFAGVATDPELQAEFANCVKHAAITLNRPEAVVWRPSLYFYSGSPRLRDIEDWF